MSTIARADLMQSQSVLTRPLAEHGCEPFVEARRRGTSVELLRGGRGTSRTFSQRHEISL